MIMCDKPEASRRMHLRFHKGNFILFKRDLIPKGLYRFLGTQAMMKIAASNSFRVYKGFRGERHRHYDSVTGNPLSTD